MRVRSEVQQEKARMRVRSKAPQEKARMRIPSKVQQKKARVRTILQTAPGKRMLSPGLRETRH